MALHLLKIAVGMEDVDHLQQVQAACLERRGRIVHVTRFAPRRADEVTDGGSLYWIVKRQIRVRQRILAIEPVRVVEAGSAGDATVTKTALVLDSELVRTVTVPRRPHQGWRYFKDLDAPADLAGSGTGEEAFPPELSAELRVLGLL